jgi:hypothetical protein
MRYVLTIDGNGLDDVSMSAQSIGHRLDDDEALRVLEHAHSIVRQRVIEATRGAEGNQ